MNNSYKPKDYNDVSPYFVVENANQLIALLIEIFDGQALRKYENPDGKIIHAEIKIGDSVLMFGEASEQYPAQKAIIHVYVPNVDVTYQKAIELGCKSMIEPKQNENDPDKRGGFSDFAGNMWSIATQFDSNK